MSDQTVPYEVQQYTNTDDVIYAGFWMRFWAYLADLIVVFCLSGIPISFIQVFSGQIEIPIGIWTLSGIVHFIVFYLYFLLMTKFFNQTIGKMIFGLKVIRKDGKALTWMDLVFREVVGRFLHRVFWFTGLLYLVVAFTPEKKGIHDMIADTRVVLTRR